MRNGTCAGRIVLGVMVIGCFLWTMMAPCQGDTIYWTGDNGNDWDTGGSDSNWSTGQAFNDDYGQAPWTLDTLIFSCKDGTNYSPTNNNMTGLEIRKLQFNHGGVQIQGNGIELDGDELYDIESTNTSGTNTISTAVAFGTDGAEHPEATIRQAAGGTLVMGGGISGGNLGKSGDGTVAIRGTNTWTGTTYVWDGTLRMDDKNTLPSSTTLHMGGGAVDFNGCEQTVANVTLANNTDLDTGSAVLTVTGTVDIDGTLDGNLTLPSAASVVFDNASTLAASVTSDNLVVEGGVGDVLLLTGDNSSLTDNVTINGGTLRLGAGSALPSYRDIIINDGTFDLDGYTEKIGSLQFGSGDGKADSGTGQINLTGNVTVASGPISAAIDGTVYSPEQRTYDVAPDSGDPAEERLRVNADLTGAGGLKKTGDGVMSLYGNNTLTGGIVVEGGALSLQSDTALNQANSVNATNGALLVGSSTRVAIDALYLTDSDVTMGIDGELSVSKVQTAGDVTFDDGFGGGTLELATAGKNLIVNGVAGDTATIGCTISGVGGVRVLGGTAQFTRYANSYEGDTSLEGGILELHGPAGGATSTLNLYDGTELRVAGNSVPNDVATLGAVEVEASGTAEDERTLAGSMTLGGVLTKTGTADLVIAGTVAGTGSIDVSEKTLRIADGGDISSVPLALSGSFAECDFDTATGTILDLSSTEPLASVTGGTVTLENQADTSYAGRLDSANFVKAGPAKLTLSSDFSLSGESIRVEAGTLATGVNQALDGASVTIAGGTVDLGTTYQCPSGLTMASGEITGAPGSIIMPAGATLFATAEGPSEIGTRLYVTSDGDLTVYVEDGAEGEDLILSQGWGTDGSFTKTGAGTLALTGTESIFDETLLKLQEGTTRIYSADSLDNPPDSPRTVCRLEGGVLEPVGSFDLEWDQYLHIGTGDQTVRVGGNDVFTVNSELQGTGDLVKTGTGVLALDGNNESSTVDLDITEGTLCILDYSALPETHLSLSGATLDMQSSGRVSYLAMTGGTVTTGTKYLKTGGVSTYVSDTMSEISGRLWPNPTDDDLGFIVADGGADVDLRISAALEEVGVITKSGAGVLELSGTNEGSGTVVEEGELRAAGGGLNPSGYLELQDGTTLVVTSGTPTVGELRLNGGSATATGGTLHLDDVICAAGSGASTMSGFYDFDGQPAAIDLGTGTTLNLDAAITAPSSSVTGEGTLQVTSLSGLDTLTVDTATIQPLALDVLSGITVAATDATLDLGGIEAQVSGLELTRGTVSNGTLALLGDVDVATSTAASTISSQVALGSTDRTFTVSAGIGTGLQVEGVVQGDGRLIKAGAGTMALTGTNLHAGGIGVSGGTLEVASDANLGAVPGSPDTDNLLLCGNGMLDVGAGFTLPSERGIQLDGAGGGLQVASGGLLRVEGAITGDGALSMPGEGTVILAGANAHLGGTSVSGGVLELGADNALPADGALSVSDATADFAGYDATLSSLAMGTAAVETSGGTLTLAAASSDDSGASSLSGTVALSGADVVFDTADSAAAVDLDAGANLGGAAGLTKTGAGTLRLGGTNTYGGTTSISGGTLLLNAAGALPTGNPIRIEGGTLDTGDRDISSTDLTLLTGSVDTGTGTLSLGGDLAQTGPGTATVSGTVDLGAVDRQFTAEGRLEVHGPITGAGGLTKAGSGDLLITQTGYTGATAVQAGTLILGTDNLLDGTVTVGTGAELNLDTYEDTVEWVDLTGGTVSAGTGGQLALTQGLRVYSSSTGAELAAPASISAANTTFDVAESSATYELTVSEGIGGSGGVRKTGEGTMLLTAAGTYTGGTTVEAGTLRTGADNLLPAGRAVTVSGGTLDIGSTDQDVSSLALTGSEVSGTSGVLSIDSLQSQASATTSTVTAYLDLGSTTRTVSAADGEAATDLHISGNIAGDAGITFDAEGAAVLLSGTNSCAGETHVSGGTVALQYSASLPSQNLHVAGTLDTQNNDVTLYSLTLDGGTVRSSSGSVTLPEEVTVDSDADTSTLEGKVLLHANDTDFTTNGTLDVSATVGGSRKGVAKSGLGTLTFSGTSANTFTGTTTVEMGTLNLNKDGAVAIPGDLVLDGGTLTFQASDQLASSCDVTVNNASVDVGGHTSAANTVTLNGSAAFSGSGGALGGDLLGASTSVLTVDGTLGIGAADSYSGFRTSGILQLESNADLTLNAKGFATLGIDTSMDYATLRAPNGVFLGGGCALHGDGTLLAPVAAGYGSTIEADGWGLTIGDADAPDGFYSDGTLIVGEETVAIADANEAVLGSLTTLGANGNEGTLSAANGFVLRSGCNLTGYGSVEGEAVIDGYVSGEGPEPGNEAIEFLDEVSGHGTFAGNVTFSGGFSPGHSCADVELENVTFGPASVLLMEIGGTSPGTEYDQLLISGHATLSGELELALINGYSPSSEDSFALLNWSTSTGSFDSVILPELGLDLDWDTSQLASGGTLSIRAIPEPCTGWLLLFIVAIALRSGTMRFR